MATDPYVRWRQTALWDVISRCLAHLSDDGLLMIADSPGARDVAVGELCSWLDGLGYATGTRRARVRARLEEYGYAAALRDGMIDALALEVCSCLDDAHEQSRLTELLTEFELTFGTQQRPDHELIAVARALSAAYHAPA